MTRAKGPAFRLLFRRRREGRTNYAKRLALIKSNIPRMIVRKSNRGILVQFINFDPIGDKTLCAVGSSALIAKYSWPAKRNSWTAYLAGLLAARLARKAGVENFILDIGMYNPSKGSVVFAALKGAVDSGLKTKYLEEKVPIQKLSDPPENLKNLFQDVKNKILTEGNG